MGGQEEQQQQQQQQQGKGSSFESVERESFPQDSTDFERQRKTRKGGREEGVKKNDREEW